MRAIIEMDVRLLAILALGLVTIFTRRQITRNDGTQHGTKKTGETSIRYSRTRKRKKGRLAASERRTS